MAQLEYFYKKLINRKELVDNFTVMHPASDVMKMDVIAKIVDYKEIFEEYYKFKPTVKMIYASESSHKKLEELRQAVMAKYEIASSALDDVGFNIVCYLGSLENSFETIEGKECVCVSQALGEACCKYLSIEAQREWIKIINPIQHPEDDHRKEGQPLYLFIKTKGVLVPGEELEQRQEENYVPDNNNNM